MMGSWLRSSRLNASVLWIAATLACTKSEAPRSAPGAETAACCTNDQDNAARAHDHAGHAAASAHEATSLASVKVIGSASRAGIEVRVQNHGDKPVKLASRVRVESVTSAARARASSGAAAVVAGEGPDLRWSCAQPVQPCVTLAPGAELIPPALPGRKDRGACGACAECPDVAAGGYQLVVTECEGHAEAKSEPFDVGEGAALGRL